MAEILSIQDFPVDEELISAATASLQAHEKLSSLVRAKLKDNPDAIKAIDDSNNILDSLRHLKSSIEGTQFKFSPISLPHDQVALLKHLVVAHTPGNINEETKAKITHKLEMIFEGQVKRLLYACVLSCPWFASSQSEVSSQAKNNILYVVYVSRDEQFFSLATQHERDLCETIDEGPLFACEVRHFCSQLQRSNVRAIEALLSPPEGVVFSTPQWFRLVQLVHPPSLFNRTFIERCLGQAMGGLVRKRPVSNRLIIRDDASMTKFCDSFRLLSYADAAVKKESASIWFEVGRDEREKEIIKSLTEAFEGLVHKEKLLQFVLDIKANIEKEMEGVVKEPLAWTKQMGEWLYDMRMEGVKFTLQDPFLPPDSDPLRGFLDSLGLGLVHSRDVIVIAKAGSHMYNLATPTSDTDYIVVFREPTDRIIRSSVNLKESMDNRGHNADTETAAYECRLFSEMLLKGAVNMFELIHAREMYYSSAYWNELLKYSESFMSEKVVLQYIGFVKTHMKLIYGKKHIGTPRERKLFYQVFHKLLSLESFVKGGPPKVICKDEDRDYIMKIRNGPLETSRRLEQTSRDSGAKTCKQLTIYIMSVRNSSLTVLRHTPTINMADIFRDDQGLPDLYPDDPHFELITKIPDEKTNPEGKVARDALVAFIKLNTEGKSDYNTQQISKWFNAEFYPDTVSDAVWNLPKYTNDVGKVMDEYVSIIWSSFARALACYGIHYNTSTVSIDIAYVNDILKRWNGELMNGIFPWYEYIIVHNLMDFDGDHDKAKDIYIKNICTNDWVNYKMLLYQNGKWPDGEWEEFHHWIKLKGLGASDSEINSTISTLRGLGLKIFDRVTEDNWKSYMNYYDPPEISSSHDTDEESKPHQIKEVEYYRDGKYWMVKEGISRNYCDTYSGWPYCDSNPPDPPSSCFSGNTLVLMADSSLKPIKDVLVGESVKTTSGARKVVLVSMPPKGNRVMYHINGLDFSFTNRHPFINPTPHQPRYMAVSPIEALKLLPTLSSEGIGQVSKGSKLLGYDPKKMMTLPVTVNSVAAVDDIPGENVYDLVLELNGSGQFEYIVGTQEALFAVSSELPTFANATYSELLAASVLLHFVSELLPKINKLYSKDDSEAFRRKIIKAINHVLMIGSCHGGSTSKGNVLTIKNKSDFIQNFQDGMKAFTTDASYNPAAGIFFDHLMAILFRHLSFTIDMGCCYVPSSIDNSSFVLAIGLVDILVNGDCSHDTLQKMSIIVKADDVTVTHKLSGKVAAGEYRAKINEVLYLPIKSSDGNVSIEFKSNMKFRAFTYSIKVPFSGITCKDISLITGGGAVGKCHIGMRCLTDKEMEKEKNERHQCSDDESLKIANGLCHIGMEEFNKLL